MIRFLYNFLWPLGLLIFLPGYFAKMIRRGGYREKFGQRLGIYDGEVRNRLSNQRSTWLHAVSVGEVNIALKLANALRALEPDLHCVLTTTTTTGFALARKTAPPWIEVMYTPLDYWPIMRRAFSVIRPARIVLVEAEVWPNLAAAAHARRIPSRWSTRDCLRALSDAIDGFGFLSRRRSGSSIWLCTQNGVMSSDGRRSVFRETESM